MRQAIEERFILDVLQNYTTFKRYFKLIKTIPTDDEYEKKKAIRLLTSKMADAVIEGNQARNAVQSKDAEGEGEYIDEVTEAPAAE